MMFFYFSLQKMNHTLKRDPDASKTHLQTSGEPHFFWQLLMSFVSKGRAGSE
jgi:hypothetical protein